MPIVRFVACRFKAEIAGTRVASGTEIRRAETVRALNHPRIEEGLARAEKRRGQQDSPFVLGANLSLPSKVRIQKQIRIVYPPWRLVAEREDNAIVRTDG